MKPWLKWVGIGLLLLLIVIQFVPVNKTNPPVTQEVKWDVPETRALAQRACFDCHSNETQWLWYDNFAPASWLVANHITDGRRALNFSQWDQPNAGFDDVRKSIKNDEMPLSSFTFLHPEARLTADEKATLLSGLEATFNQDPPIARPRRGPRGGG